MTNILEGLYDNGLISSDIKLPNNISHGYVLLSGPPPDAKTAWKGIDKTPTLYLFGGVNQDGSPNQYLYLLYNGSTNFTQYLDIPIPLTDCKGCYVPQYKDIKKQLGIFILSSKNEGHVISFDIKHSTIQFLPNLPPIFRKSTTMAIEFVDDVSGPYYVIMDKKHSKFATEIANKFGSCARNRNIWFTEGSKYWYLNTDENGSILGGWNEGPSIPYPVDNFQFGRVFLRHQNTYWGISTCAMLCIYGGIHKHTKEITNKVQCLVTFGKDPNIKYSMINIDNNDETNIPNSLLLLPEGIHSGVGLTSQWPEMLITGDRCLCVGYNKNNEIKMFMTELRFGDTIFGDEYKWQILNFPKIDELRDLVTAAPLDQHIPNLHFRKSNFILASKNKKTMNLQLGPIRYYPAVESVQTTPDTLKEFYKIYKSLAIKDSIEWSKLFKNAEADKFINMEITNFIDNIGVPFVVPQDGHDINDMYTLLYRSSWLGKVFIRDWKNVDNILVSNKFTELGNMFFHPKCEKSNGLNIAGKVERYGVSLMDKKPCWVLTYGCESGTHILPTMPPVPIDMIRDELRYTKYMERDIIIGTTYIIHKNRPPKQHLFFALIPSQKLILMD